MYLIICSLSSHKIQEILNLGLQLESEFLRLSKAVVKSVMLNLMTLLPWSLCKSPQLYVSHAVIKRIQLLPLPQKPVTGNHMIPGC